MSMPAQPAYARSPPPFSAPLVPREYSGSIPPCADTLSVLQEVFEVLRHDWIRNFLFTPDPIQVSILTSLSAAFAVNVVFRESCIGRDISSTDPFQVTVEGETVLVPAFSHGRYSVGIGIKKRISDIPKDTALMPWTGQLTSEHLRFVADSDTGNYFVIRNSRHLPFVFIEVFSLLSAVHRKRTVLTFHVSKLYDLVRRYDFESFPYIVHNALAMVQVINETRECNGCGTALEPKCRCKLMTFKPQSPLDFESMKKNLSSHFGAFQGFETLYLYTRGAQIASAELGARFSVVLGTDPKRTRDLVYWAINDRMVGERPGPLRQLTPISNDSTDEEELFGYFGDLNDLEEEEEMKKNVNDVEAQPLEGRKCDTVGSPRRSPSPIEDPCLVKGSTEASDGSRESPETPSTESQDDDNNNIVVVHRDPERQAKMRIRKEKNREAARRSNLSKKLKNEQMRQQLAEETIRMSELQAREAELRVENSRLRKLASATSSS